MWGWGVGISSYISQTLEEEVKYKLAVDVPTLVSVTEQSRVHVQWTNLPSLHLSQRLQVWRQPCGHPGGLSSRVRPWPECRHWAPAGRGALCGAPGPDAQSDGKQECDLCGVGSRWPPGSAVAVEPGIDGALSQVSLHSALGPRLVGEPSKGTSLKGPQRRDLDPSSQVPAA